MKLNETPVRTCRNFNINNIKIDEAEFIKKVQEFNNIEISGIDVDLVDDNVSNCNFKYGVSADLIEEINSKANHKLRFTVADNSNVEIISNFDEDNNCLIDNIEINAKENTTSNVIIKYKSEEDLKYYHNGAIRVNAEKNTNINITIVNLLNTLSNNFISIENELEENAVVSYTIVDFGGKHSITNYYSNLSRKNSKKSNKYDLSRKRKSSI